MVTLRLFHVTDPFRPIETRTLGADEVQIGRDPGAGWMIEDAACELSRRHCAVRLTETGVSVRDLSANGVFCGAARQRLQRGVETIIAADQSIYLGQFMITIEPALQSANDRDETPGRPLDAPFQAPMLQEPVLSAADFIVHDHWEHPAAPATRSPLPEAAFLEAFCEGAGLDPSAFMGEDVSDVARRAGAVYRQAVLGLSDLMSERMSLKSEFEMNRTRVGAINNNPFKWAEPHRIALDLLRAGNDPFLSDGAAVKASFQDLKKHMLCVMAGSRAPIAAALDEVGPAKAEADVGPGLLFNAAKCWSAFQKRHAAVIAGAYEDAQGVVSRAFKDGYERHVRKLDALSTIS